MSAAVIKPNTFARQKIEKLKLHCPNAGAGCKEVVQLGKEGAVLAEHLGACSFQGVPCDLCAASVLRNDLVHHKQAVCKRRWVACPHCEASLFVCFLLVARC